MFFLLEKLVSLLLLSTVTAFTSMTSRSLPSQSIFRSSLVTQVPLMHRFNYESHLEMSASPILNDGQRNSFSKSNISDNRKRGKRVQKQRRKTRRKRKQFSNPSKQEELWKTRYQELLEFFHANGHSNVPYNHPNKKLSRWVTNQRQNKKLNRQSMTKDRIEKLNAIEFLWETRSTWEDRFQELEEYSLLYGHCNVLPSTNLDLSRFVSSQRRQYKLLVENTNFTSISLNQKRIDALTSIGFEFRTHGNSNDLAWMAKFNQLKQFYEKHNHCFVPCKDKNLRRWVDAQRTAYRLLHNNDRKHPTISRERIHLLNTIQFEWNPIDAKFKERIEEIKTFHEKYGHCEVSMSDKPTLCTWIKNQKNQYVKFITSEKSSLTKERIELLLDVGIELDLTLSSLKQRRSKTPWSVKFNELREYKEENGHCCVPQKDPRLGEFVKAQRYSYRQMKMGKKSSMTSERVNKLNSIGFKWSVNGRTRPLKRIATSSMMSNSLSTTDEKSNSERLLRFYEKRSLWGTSILY